MIAHEPLVTTEDFEAAQTIRADQGRSRQGQRETSQQVRHPYVLRSLLFCGLCKRKMQAQRSGGLTYYRCRYPREYALAAHVEHPVNVYLRETDVLPPLDHWLTSVFAPHRLEDTVRALVAAQAPAEPMVASLAEDAQAMIADCDAKLARYQAALDAGADPVAVASWTRKVQAERASALARAPRPTATAPTLTEADIQQISTLGNLAAVIREADPTAKAKVCAGLSLRLTYQPGQQLVRAEAQLAPQDFGAMGRVRGGTHDTARPDSVSEWLAAGSEGHVTRRLAGSAGCWRAPHAAEATSRRASRSVAGTRAHACWAERRRRPRTEWHGASPPARRRQPAGLRRRAWPWGRGRRQTSREPWPRLSPILDCGG